MVSNLNFAECGRYYWPLWYSTKFSQSKKMDFLDFQDTQGSQYEFHYDEQVLQPEPAVLDHCSYCTITSPSSLVKCIQCSKYFCNSGTQSHIIHHLVKSKHKKIALHPQSTLGDVPIECYQCGCKNVFLLGFIPAKSDTVVVILCRQPCAHPSNKDIQWDLSQWTPLIENRQLLPWLVQQPSEKEVLIAGRVTREKMNLLEELWRENETATMIDVEGGGLGGLEQVEKVKMVYEDAYEYQNIYAPLVKMESDYDRLVRESQTQQEVVVRWSTTSSTHSHYSKKIAYFVMERVDVSEVRLGMGDELVLSYHGELHPPWSYTGRVIKVPDVQSDEIGIEVKGNDKEVPTDCTHHFHVDFVWKSTSYDRYE
jgi:regulator of nonsense transcripts 1